MTAIVGPNGSGKSTIFLACRFALWGTKTIRSNKDRLKRFGATPKEHCRVLLEFDFAGRNIVVERALRGAALATHAELTVDGYPMAEGVTPVYEAMVNLLGLDENMFEASFFAAQKDLARILTMGTAERLQMVLELSGLSRLADYAERVSLDGHRLRGKIAGLEQGLADKETVVKEIMRLTDALADAQSRSWEGHLKAIEAELAAHQKEVVALDEQRQEAEQLRERIQQVRDGMREPQRVDAVRNLCADLTELETSRHRLDNANAVLQAYDEIAATLTSTAAVAARFERKKALAAEREQKASDFRRLSREQKQVQAQLEVALAALKDLSAKRKELDNIQNDLKKARKQVVDINARRAALEEKGRAISEQMSVLETLGPESPCPVCQRKLGHHAERQRQHLKDEQAKIQKMLEQCAKKLAQAEQTSQVKEEELRQTNEEIAEIERRAGGAEQLRERLATLKRDIKSIVQTGKQIAQELEALGSINFDPERHKQLQEEFQRLQQQRDAIISLQDQMKRYPELRQRLQKIRGWFGRQAKEVVRLQKQVRKQGFDPKRLEEARRGEERLRSLHRAIEDKQRQHDRAIAVLETSLQKERERLASLEAQAAQIENDRQQLFDLGRLHKAYGLARAKGLNALVPLLSDLMTEIFAPLTGYKYRAMTVDEKFNLVPEHAIGGPVTPDELSGSEEDLAALSYRLALAQIIITMNSKGAPSEFFALDEPFAHYDKVRQQEVMRHVVNLAQRFRQVLLITHEEQVKQLADHVLSVEWKNGGSEIAAI